MSAAMEHRQPPVRHLRTEPVHRARKRNNTQPVARQVTRPVARGGTQSVTRPVPQQVARQVTRPVPQQVARPAARQATRRKTNPPELRVVRPVTKSKFSKATTLIVVLTSVLAFIVIFQTVIAEQQLRLDRVSTDVRLARQHYNELRQQRAELRAPDYLRAQAIILGMWPGSGAKFEDVPAEVVTMVLASTGEMDEAIAKPKTSDDLILETTGSAP